MPEFPHPWGMYARLQSNLRRNNQLGDRSWGAEAGMDHILDSTSGAPPSEEDVKKVISTSRRRERDRSSRRAQLVDDSATAHPDCALIARSELAAIRRRFGARDWDLLAAVGIGSSYKDISAVTSESQGAVRVRVTRLRASLAEAA
jgi:hypothetical protein